MAIGFSSRFDFNPVIGWELYQVTIDKYHLMFWFENENSLLNIADRCSFKSSDGTVTFTYEIYGSHKSLNVDHNPQTHPTHVRTMCWVCLVLGCENGDILSIYDNPELRSWWFLGGRQDDPRTRRTSWALNIGDWEPEDLSDVEWASRRSPNRP